MSKVYHHRVEAQHLYDRTDDEVMGGIKERGKRPLWGYSASVRIYMLVAEKTKDEACASQLLVVH